MVRDEFQIGGADVQFYPFWEQETSAIANNENVLVSSYTGERGIFAVVTNMQNSEQQVSVDFSKIPQKIEANWKAWNAQTGAALALQENIVNVTIPPKDFVLVRIAPREVAEVEMAKVPASNR